MVKPTAVGLFAGIGGIELGLGRAGFRTVSLCEIDTGAQAVLLHHFPRVRVEPDVRLLDALPNADVVAAGFPCQDLSQAGQTAGIHGKQSGLVRHVFELLEAANPRWLLLENVPFMLQLNRGRAMRYLVDELERLRFRWAYRVVDARAFGLPQRRQRVLLVASRTEDPCNVLFADEAVPHTPEFSTDRWCGFYWTEGLRGLGWAVDAIPTLKGGSTIGIPSAPAIWNPTTGAFFTPDIRDAERLQGFDPDWTKPAADVLGVRPGHRWKLVGNAVNVPVAEWVGGRLRNPGVFDRALGSPLKRGVAWPKAAFGDSQRVYSVDISMWPVATPATPLAQFVRFQPKPLSGRAAAGFASRLSVSGLQTVDGFRESIKHYVSRATRWRVA
jgi:DNA (cytosine-5)-methyltransferase 1